MGVDATVITAERIKEELKNGKSLDGALKSGFARGLTPIIDGNVTIVIVAIVLMGAFGPSDGLFAKALHFVFFAFGPSTAGTVLQSPGRKRLKRSRWISCPCAKSS